MLFSIALLLVCQLAGEVGARLLGLPVPGPVLGMLVLMAVLAARGEIPATLADTADGLLRYLPLLFVPAGVGVFLHGHRLAAEWPAVLGAVVLSLVASLLGTAVLMRALLRWTDARDGRAGPTPPASRPPT